MGANVYYLPYFFGRLGPADARDLYGLLYDLVHAGEMSPLESAYRSYQDTPRLQEVGERFRFYVAAVMEHQTKRFDVFGDSMDGTLFSPVELTRELTSGCSSRGCTTRRVTPTTPVRGFEPCSRHRTTGTSSFRRSRHC